jgi:hypothetical protein
VSEFGVAPRAKIDMGKVIGETFQVLGRNLGPFLVLAVILVGVPGVVLGLLSKQFVTDLRPTSNPLYWTFAVGRGFFGLILQAAIIYGVVNDLNGRKALLIDSLRVALRVFLPLVAIGILSALAVGLGMILLIVPGVILLLAWSVTVPVYVMEERGIIETFGRSAALTRDNRWRILGIYLLLGFAFMIINFIIMAIFGASSFFSGGVASMAFMTTVIAAPIIAVISALVTSTLISTLYVELRRLKDGTAAADLGAVFD